MRKAIFFSVCGAFMLALAPFTFGQAERVSETEYNTALTRALDSASSMKRRIVTEETFYAGSRAKGTRQIVSDFMGNDAKKIDVVEEFNGKRTSSNSITLNGQFFCRDGEKAWKRADKECAKAGKMMAIPDGEYEYSVEPHPDRYGWTIYTRRATWTDSGVAKRDAARLKFIEIKFVADASGLITDYTETRRGGIEPNGWSSTQVTRYIYEPADLKIGDPTKGN
ncbi:MAG: hypothetical protein AB7F88_10255 [Pyrinomonadaceae bacterium]